MSDQHAVHAYRTQVSWSGSTGVGYDAYGRTHDLRVEPGVHQMAMSADPAFGGDAALTNPEQLLLAAASSCQLLSFLAVAARSRVDVLAYADAAEAIMPEDVTPMKITRIVLRPVIVVASGTDHDRVRRIVRLAHEACFIARTLDTEMIIEPTITDADDR